MSLMRKVLLYLFFPLTIAGAMAQENCEPIPLDSSLAEDALAIVAFENSSLISSGGIEIDSDTCILEAQRRTLLTDLPRSDSKGLACLSTLARAGGKKAAENLERLMKLRASGIRVVCETASGVPIDTDFSAPDSQLLALPSDFAALSESERRAFLFHEQFHLLGYSHESGPDFADGCDECCFSSSTPDTTSAACRLCAGGEVP